MDYIDDIPDNVLSDADLLDLETLEEWEACNV